MGTGCLHAWGHLRAWPLNEQRFPQVLPGPGLLFCKVKGGKHAELEEPPLAPHRVQWSCSSPAGGDWVPGWLLLNSSSLSLQLPKIQLPSEKDEDLVPKPPPSTPWSKVRARRVLFPLLDEGNRMAQLSSCMCRSEGSVCGHWQSHPLCPGDPAGLTCWMWPEELVGLACSLWPQKSP